METLDLAFGRLVSMPHACGNELHMNQKEIALAGVQEGLIF